MKIRIAHSPDSDDAFMFYALATGKVRSPGFELEHVLSDIETLNRAAFEGRYEITAVSFHAYAHLTDRYILLPHGASMGDRYGRSSSRRGRCRPSRAFAWRCPVR
jgi:1,4-dihydroxy-6-naphthoate synthase